MINEIRACHERGQPVLVGTTSIEANEKLSAELKAAGLPHKVLNAKQHEREAEVIAQAGMPGGITIATNMAGRGTDIVLGGSIQKELDAIRTDESLSEAEKERAPPRSRPTGRCATSRAGGRRPAHHRHRTPRIAPRRQPAARPFRTPGRPRLQPLLPVAGRPAAAHLRLRPRRRDHEPPEDAGRRGDRASMGDARDRERAAQGRTAQLRHPQAAARIRRRVERPAQGDLRTAQRNAGEHRHRRHHPRHARRRAERHHQPAHRAGQHGRAVGRGGPGKNPGRAVLARPAAAAMAG